MRARSLRRKPRGQDNRQPVDGVTNQKGLCKANRADKGRPPTGDIGGRRRARLRGEELVRRHTQPQGGVCITNHEPFG
jgi:hypothetical protein